MVLCIRFHGTIVFLSRILSIDISENQINFRRKNTDTWKTKLKLSKMRDHYHNLNLKETKTALKHKFYMMKNWRSTYKTNELKIVIMMSKRRVKTIIQSFTASGGNLSTLW